MPVKKPLWKEFRSFIPLVRIQMDQIDCILWFAGQFVIKCSFVLRKPFQKVQMNKTMWNSCRFDGMGIDSASLTQSVFFPKKNSKKCFNIGVTTPITKKSDLWERPYLHWNFVPKNYTKNEGMTKRHKTETAPYNLHE